MLYKILNEVSVEPQSPYSGEQFPAIELFSGCGGLAVGSRLAGFKHVLACEHNPVYAYSYHVNMCERRTTILQRDASHPRPGDYTLPDDIKLLAGGPPCQPFSTAQGKVDENDKRASSFFYPINWVDEYEPDCVLIENVPNLKNKHSDTLSSFRGELEQLGYTTQMRILNTADYLVPQTRERLFIIGVHESVPTPTQWFPQPIASDRGEQVTLDGEKTREYMTAKDALEDLPDPVPSEPPSDDPLHQTIAESHISTSGSDSDKVDPHTPITKVRRDDWRVEAIPPNHVSQDHRDTTREKYSQYRLGYMNDDNNGATERRLDPDKPAPTMIGSNGTPPIHYRGRSPEYPGRPVDRVRRLTPREIARIQTFPDGFAVAGSKKEQCLQFANAVPPALAFFLTTHIRSHIIEENI